MMETLNRREGTDTASGDGIKYPSQVQNYQEFREECSNRWGQIWGYLLVQETYDTTITLGNCLNLIQNNPTVSKFTKIPFKNRQSIYIFGRDENCDIIVNKPSISSRHFQIYKETLEELNVVRVNISDTSLNGTFVNGIHLKKGKTTILYHNDEICVPLGGDNLFMSMYVLLGNIKSHHIYIKFFNTFDRVQVPFIPARIHF